MADISFSMTADDGDVTKALQNLVKENAKLREEISKGVAQSKEEARAAKESADAQKQHSAAMKEAEQIVQKNMTAGERYQAQIKKLNDLRAQGVLSAKDHAKAMEGERLKMAESGQATGSFSSTLQTVGPQLLRVAGGFASVQAVMKLIGDEIRGVMELQKKAGDATVNLGAEQEALLQNLGGANAGQVSQQLKALSQRTGVAEGDVTRAVNESMAARGDFDVSQVIKAVGSVGKIRKFAPTEMAGLAAATIDTQRQTGLGTDEALGFLLQMQGQSRTKSLKELAANMVPGVGGIMQFGADRATAGALLASMSHGMGDTTGAASRTASLQLAGQLREFGNGAPIGQTIAQLQQNQALREKFLSTASFEVAARPAVEALLGGGKVAQNFAAARQAMQANPLEALAQAEKDRAAFAPIGLAEKQLGLKNVAQQALLNNPRAAEAGIVREGLSEIEKSLPGQGALMNRARMALREFESGAYPEFESAVSGLRETVQQRRQGRDDAAFSKGMLLDTFVPFGKPGVDVFADRNLKDKEFVRQTELMAKTVDLLERLVDQGQGKNREGAAIGRAVNQREAAGGP